MSIPIPRIQGRVGKAESDDPKFKDKWLFEIFFSALGQEDKKTSLGTFGPYDTESKAMAELRNAVRMVCETAEKSICGKASGKYIDMKTNYTRNWDEN